MSQSEENPYQAPQVSETTQSEWVRRARGESDLEVGDWILAVLCSGIGCIMGIVWMVQGKPKGIKMFGVSTCFALGLNSSRVNHESRLAKAARPHALDRGGRGRLVAGPHGSGGRSRGLRAARAISAAADLYVAVAVGSKMSRLRIDAELDSLSAWQSGGQLAGASPGVADGLCSGAADSISADCVAAWRRLGGQQWSHGSLGGGFLRRLR
jgi:hypothetical protein